MQFEFSQLIDALPALAWIALADGRIEIVNRRWCDYTGFSQDRAIGDGWQSAIHPNDLALVRERWCGSLASGQPGEVEARLKRHDGQFRRFQISVSPMTDDSGRIVKWCGINTDIEDRVRSDETSRKRQWAFEQVVDGMPGILALFTPGGKIMFSNRQMLAYLDETLEQVQSKVSAYNFHPDDRDEVLEEWAAAVQSGKPFDREARLCDAHGVYRWHRTRVFPLRNTAGEIELWYGLSTDINDAKTAEATLAAEKRMLERVALGAPLPDVLAAISREVEALVNGCHCCIQLVDSTGERFQVGGASSLPDAFNAICHGKTIDRDYDPGSLAVVSKTVVIVDDIANDPRWDSSAWRAQMADHGLGSCCATPVMSSSQQPVGVLSVYRREPRSPAASDREVTNRFATVAGIAIQRAQVDDALREKELELRRAYGFLTEAQRLSNTGSFVWDAASGEETWSEELYRIFEIEPGTKITLPLLRQFVHPDDLALLKATTEQAIAGGEPDYFFRIVTSRGAVKHLHCVGHRSEQITDRPVYIGAIQDVTESKRAEEDLNRARADLTHVARVMTLSALTASIAHEVNQPLLGIITNASTCLRMLAADPPNLDGARATAQRTLRDGNRASEVIQRLRSLFARNPPTTAPVDLNDAASEVLTLSSSELQRNRVILRTDLHGGLPAVRGDRVQLQQVMLNLILNAADAMKDVDDRPRHLVVATAREDTNRVRVSVSDSGVGIDPPNRDKLFEAFYTTKTNGMGIGLAISRSIVESHNGRLWATANDGPGATFSFSIPYGSESSTPLI